MKRLNRYCRIIRDKNFRDEKIAILRIFKENEREVIQKMILMIIEEKNNKQLKNDEEKNLKKGE